MQADPLVPSGMLLCCCNTQTDSSVEAPPHLLCYRFQAFVAEGNGPDTPLTGVVEVSLQSSQVYRHTDHLLLMVHS